MTHIPTNTVIENADLSGLNPRDHYAREILTAAAALNAQRMSMRRYDVVRHDHMNDLRVTRTEAERAGAAIGVNIPDVARDIERQALVLLTNEIATYHERINA